MTSALKAKPNKPARTACPISHWFLTDVQAAGSVCGVQPLSTAFIGATIQNHTPRPIVALTAAANVQYTAGRRARTRKSTSQVRKIDAISIGAPSGGPKAMYRWCCTASHCGPERRSLPAISITWHQVIPKASVTRSRSRKRMIFRLTADLRLPTGGSRGAYQQDHQNG